VRDPDYVFEIDRDSIALAWTKMGEAVAGMVAQVTGLSMDEAREVAREAGQGDSLELPDEELIMRAWKVELPRRPEHTDVASWLVNGPFHPFWRWWTIHAIHLREQAGAEPPDVRVEGASHEVMILSHDPDHEMSPELVEAGQGSPHLTPIDLAHQVVGLHDEQAAQLVELMVRYIGSGRISPDQDFRGHWGPILDNTAEHLRFGTHPSWN
jgi:hypothetical protein